MGGCWQMGVDTLNVRLSENSMEEIDIFKTESPTGERIKLFVDELEALEPCNVEPPRSPRDFPVQSHVAQAMDLDFMLDIDAEIE